jgi:hypothetical protein
MDPLVRSNKYTMLQSRDAGIIFMIQNNNLVIGLLQKVSLDRQPDRRYHIYMDTICAWLASSHSKHHFGYRVGYLDKSIILQLWMAEKPRDVSTVQI